MRTISTLALSALSIAVIVSSAPPAVAVVVRFVVDEANTDGNVHGNLITELQAGDRIRAELEVDNSNGDHIQLLSSSIEYEPSLVEFSQGSIEPAILVEDAPFGAPALRPIIDSAPNAADPTLISALNFVTYGDPPDSQVRENAASVEFVVIASSGTTVLRHVVSSYDCSLIAGDGVWSEIQLGPPLLIVVPEPLGALPFGLISLAALRPPRRRTRNRQRASPRPRKFSRPGIVLLLTLCIAPTTGQAQAGEGDRDQDGVPDAMDNCLIHPNGPNDLSNQIDTDQDGYGNRCDPDFDQDGIGTGADWNLLLDNFNTVEPLYDLNGDGVVSSQDVKISILFFDGAIGPSGLVCANSAIRVAAGDPPCLP